MALGLQCLDDADFLRRIDPGVYLYLLDARTQDRIVQRGQVRAGQDRGIAARHDAQAVCNGAGGGGMVAGDHHRGDARADAVAHGGHGFRARRVDECDQA